MLQSQELIQNMIKPQTRRQVLTVTGETET